MRQCIKFYRSVIVNCCQCKSLITNLLLADAEAVNSLTYKRVEIKSVQASYIFYVCKWLTHCDLIHYKPHLPN